MDGKHHKMFAPAFSLGIAELMLQTGIINESLGQMGVILAAGASLLTATAPDRFICIISYSSYIRCGTI